MFCRRRTLLVSWFLFLLGVAAVPAADSVLIRTNYYVVTGSTPREIADSMTQARPWKDRMAMP